MSLYVTIAELKLLGTIPPEDVDALETAYPGVVDAIGQAVSGTFDSKLAKRYAAPFQTPYPDTLKDNVAKVMSLRLMMKRGFNPSSAQDQEIIKQAEEAKAWLAEAADGKDGLVELPIKQASPAASAVNIGAPLGYSEASPYTWTDRQREAVLNGG